MYKEMGVKKQINSLQSFHTIISRSSSMLLVPGDIAIK